MDSKEQAEGVASHGEEEVEPSTVPSQPAMNIADVPDPDEDELDDLDDMLDEFSATKIESSDPPAASGPGRPTQSESSVPHAAAPPLSTSAPSEDVNAKQMEADMADLLGEIGSDPQLQQTMEQFMKALGGSGLDINAMAGQDPEQLMEALGGAAGLGGDGPEGQTPPASSTSAQSTSKSPPPAQPATAPRTANPPNPSDTTTTIPTPTAEDNNFQETIRRTMERMQNSGEQASAAATSEPDPDDILAEMLKQMQQAGAGGSGAPGTTPGSGPGDEEDLSKMLLGMMEQLTNKEILYDPMKELHDKFPDWMRDNRDAVSPEDLRRYEEQQGLVREIVERFERVGYKDENVQDREFIVERMQKMQAAGSPPPDLVGNTSAAQEALGDLEGGCPQQ